MDPATLLFLSVVAVAVASPTEAADKALLKAYLKQSGIEQNLSRTGKQLERELSNEARVYLGYMAYISKTAIDKKIVFTWRF